ncbi:MAG: hypothetical protein GY913_34685 [Proteobacteria bacterium]|nr:hypothetical protein [Pseudomonadota bacterium]MCP4922078.1 hypothetical protein [Pseudomonadota bacterium]
MSLWVLLACAPDAPTDVGSDPVFDTAVEHLPDAPQPVDPQDALFDPGVIHDVYLELDGADWLAVRDDPWTKTWVSADLRWGEHELEDIGIRAFGSGSMRAGKPSLKLSFDRNIDGQELAGLDELKLDNSSQDVGYLDEFVATLGLRRAGIPAIRTGWVRLHVNGQAAGFFVLLESIDDRFVERWFGHDDGPLYSMNAHNWGQGLNPMTDPLYWYEPETSFGGDGTELAAAAAALESGDADAIEALVDVDGFFRESIARSVMGSLDSFSADGNNFYLFVDDGRVRIIPWDCDVDLGAYYLTTALTVDPSAPWLTSPWSYNSATSVPYTDPVLLWNLAAGRDPDAMVAELLADGLDWATLDDAAVAAAELIHDEVHADVFGVGASFDQRRHDLRLFLHTRWSWLAGEDVDPACDGPGTTSELSPSGTVGWHQLVVDETGYWGPGFVVAGEHYCSGLFAHAPSTVTLEVPVGELTGLAGMQDWAQACSDGATFHIWQDDVELWASEPLGNYDAAEPFSVDVSAGRVTLTVEPGETYYCDTSSWLDLRVE